MNMTDSHPFLVHSFLHRVNMIEKQLFDRVEEQVQCDRNHATLLTSY
jgi:hypothetical protein